MIYVHNLIWELSSVEITCELTGSGESRLNTSWRKGAAGSKYEDVCTKDAAEDSTGARKNDWLPGLQDNSIRRYIVLLPEFRIAFSGDMHQC